jgi:F0F1-type ATP synthase membrane subunit b/b'
MLLIFINQLIAQTIPVPPSWVAEFPFSVGLLIVIVLLLYWFIKSTEKRFEKRDDELRKYNEDREEKIKSNNEAREKAMLQQLEQLTKLIDRIGQDWRETNLKLDRNYQDSINKFLDVVKQQAEQNNYSIEVLTKVEQKIEELSKKSHLTKNDFIEFKNEVVNILSKMGIEYNLSKKG